MGVQSPDELLKKVIRGDLDEHSSKLKRKQKNGMNETIQTEEIGWKETLERFPDEWVNKQYNRFMKRKEKLKAEKAARKEEVVVNIQTQPRLGYHMEDPEVVDPLTFNE